jgi:CRP/FNR family transcriptional regulator
VTNGHLKLSTVGTEGRTELVRLWEPGEVVGLVAALERRRHIGTATAVDDAAVLVLGMDRFEEILTRHPEAYPAVIWQLARWVHLAVSAQCDQGVESISVRLARLLVSLCGECDTGAVMLDVRLTQEELAQAIGTSRESAARILRTWREDGILTTRRRNIEIHDVDRLISMAHRESELD